MKPSTAAAALALLLISCVKKEPVPVQAPAPAPTQKPQKPARLIQVTSEKQFDSLFRQKDRLLAVDFYADWCGPCEMLAPDFAALSAEYGDRADFLKVNLDSLPDLGVRFGANPIPLVVLIKNGKKAEHLLGLKEISEYRSAVEKHLTDSLK